MSTDETTLEVKGLDHLIKALKAKPPKSRVGILGANNNRTSKGKTVNFNTNAAIGAMHEFGGVHMPQRSFLKMPISLKLQEEMESSGALDKEVLKQVIHDGTVLPWMKKITKLAEGIVLQAFDTGGFGKWAPWKPGYTNKSNKLLIDTQQLVKSITSECE